MNPTNSERDVRQMSVEQALIEGLTDLRDTLRAGKRVEEKYTMRTVDLQLEPQDFGADDVKAIREQLRVSQSVFAQLLGVKPRTVQSWEQGMVPPPMARRLLGMIKDDPGRWEEMLRNAAKDKAGAH